MISLSYLFETQPGQLPPSSAMLLRTNQPRQQIGVNAAQPSPTNQPQIKLQPVLNGRINPGTQHPILDPITRFTRTRQLNSLNLSRQK